MPRDRPRLLDEEIERLAKWIQGGGVWPDDGWRPEVHWAHRVPVLPELPEVEHPSTCRTPIDLFVRARLEQASLSPNPETAPANLLRRLYLDLIGLPPSVEELERFLATLGPKSWSLKVDELLASPRFGEKWARHWLDLARYADSEGYQRDELRFIWPYRDWVIAALNADLPFDQFTVEQLAGDLLPDASTSQRVASGFHRNTPVNLEAGTDPAADYHKQIVDRVGTTGSVWLGMTVACAQCHDHKYDPISTREYYQLFAFFNQAPFETRQKGSAMGSSGMVYIGPDLVVPDDPARERRRRLWQARKASMVSGLKTYLDPLWDGFKADEAAAATSLGKRLRRDSKKRTPADYLAVGRAFLKEDSRFQRQLARIEQADRALECYPLKRTRIMSDLKETRKTHVLRRGDPESLGVEVKPGTPGALHPYLEEYPLNRLGLARWLVSKENPLVARVVVNRLWAELFGRGLVETLDDFGRQGERPSHPELLDWLAVTLMEQDQWSIKAMLRRIVRSAVYRQSVVERGEGMTIDPNNRLLWRHPGHRLSAELIRDVQLSVAGLLSETMGGAPAYPWQPDGVWRSSAGAGPMHYDVAMGEGAYRRGVYTVWRRSAHYPSFANFDAPDRGACTVTRGRSNTPLQALTLMNDAVYVEAATAFARRIQSRSETTLAAKLNWAFRAMLSRDPTSREAGLLEAAYEEELALSNRADDAWFNVATILMNLHEAINRN